METKPKRGRPRKAVDVPAGVAEGEDASCLDAGNGQVSGVGAGAQKDAEGATWAEFVALVMAAQEKHYPHLRTVWHPSPDVGVIPTDHATIAVLQGVVRGQLSSGQFIDL